MVRRIVWLALAGVVAWGFLYYRNDDIFFDGVGRGEVSFYVRYEAGEISGAEVVKNGSGSIIICPFANYKSVKKRLNAVSGVSVKFTGDESDIDNVISALDVKAVIYQRLDEAGIVCYYGFSFRLRDFIKADGKWVNIQIAKNGNTVTVGYPVILGSY